MIRLFLLAISLLSLSACKKEISETKSPSLTAPEYLSVYEDDPAGYVRIIINSASKIDKTVTLFYSTLDSTALSGKDYQGTAHGQVEIPAGSSSCHIQIPIYSDSLDKHDLVFKVQIDSIINATINQSIIRVKLLNVDYSNLVWSDEFNDTVINSSNWNFETGNNQGWGNHELEVYSNSSANAFISGGNLIIKAIKLGGGYTSARMTSQNKRDFITGRIEIRAKLPQGKGIWPALWMLGSNIGTAGWPACGEIDIMELLGDNANKTYGTVHYSNSGHQSSGGSLVLTSGSFADSYHSFSLIWQPRRIKWLVDGNEYFVVNDSQVPGFAFNLPQFFIFNIAVGGDWPGNPDSNTVFPQTMAIDYIRVYQ